MRRIPLLITIFTAAVLVVAAVVIGLLYRAALSQQAALLSEIADSQARTIEGVARHEERVGRFVPDSIDHGNEFAATLDQLRDVNSRFSGFGHSGEFALARREGDSIVYLLNQRHYGLARTQVIPFNGASGEPMRRALSGLAGTVIGPDYRGVRVVAAYAPVNAFGMGVVAKIDLAEVQAPFVRDGLIGIAVALVVVLLGSLLFYRITNPVLRQLQESEARLKNAQQLAHLGSWTLDLATNKPNWSDEVYRIFGVRPQEFEATYEAFLAAVHPDDRAAVDAAYSGSVRENRDGYEIEHRVVRKKTGEVRIVHEKCEHVRNASGRIVRSVGMVHDVTEQRMAEESLRRSEVTLRGTLDATLESILLFGTDGVVLQANATAVKRFGKTGPEVVGKSLEEILPPGLASLRRARLQEVVESARPVEFEDERAGMQFRHSFYPVRDAEGRVVAVASFSRDITESRRAEQALRDSESKFRIVADNTYDFEFWLDPDGRYVYASPSCERITGYRPEEFLADPELQFRMAHPEDRDLLMDHARSVEREEPGEIDYRIVHRDGSVRWIGHVCQPILDSSGRFLGTRGSNRDITQRRLAEEALRVSEQKHRTLFETMSQGVVYQDSEGRIISANPAAERLLGLILEQMQGRTSMDPRWRAIREDGSDSPGEEHPIVVARKTGKPVGNVVTGVFNPNDGAYHWLSVNAVPLFRSGEVKPYQVYATFEDITERMESQAKLAKTVAELRRSNDDLEQFAYVASHDLQEPLRMIASYVGLLSERYRGKLDERADRYIDYAVNGARRMQLLIDGLLHYARAGTKGGLVVAVDMAAAVAEAQANLGREITDANAVVEVGPLLDVLADRGQMVQVFQNLLSNAVKFRGESPPKVAVSARDAGKEWELAVRDNGIGIDPRHAERVFGVFKRLHTVQEYAGTGIGLALCRKIVERHGGRIWFEPAEGGGSVFRFTLPKQPLTSFEIPEGTEDKEA